MEYSLELTADKAEADSAYIFNQLNLFNHQHIEPDQHALLRVFARNEKGELVGGLLGETFWHWLYIADLWVHEDHRHSGLGTQLIQQAEEEAVRRGCRHAYLDTFEFQAPDFYHKLGYSIWGVLDDFPPGHQRIFL